MSDDPRPKQIAPEEYRTRYFDDLELGERRQSRWLRLSLEEMIRFSEEYDGQYFHTDIEAAKDSPFGAVIASGAHTFAVWNRLNLEINGDIAWIAGLGFDEFRFPNPLRPGVDFNATSELIEKRPSSSDPGRGVVVHRYALVTREGQVVFRCLCPALAHRRDGPNATQ